MKERKENLNKWRDLLDLQIARLNSENIKSPINFKAIPIKVPARLFVDINNLIIK